MFFLQGTFQHARAARVLEPHKSKMAGTQSLAEGLATPSDAGPMRELRGRLMRNRFQKGRNRSPRGPYCSGKAHSAAESGQSEPARKSSVHLRNLPRLQASSGSQALLGRQIGLSRNSSHPQFRYGSSPACACHLRAVDSSEKCANSIWARRTETLAVLRNRQTLCGHCWATYAPAPTLMFPSLQCKVHRIISETGSILTLVHTQLDRMPSH